MLEEIATLLELKDENVFKVRAYRNGARLVESLASPVADLAAKGTLGDLPGIGEALREKITTFVTTGRLPYLEELRASLPAGLLDLVRIPGLGPKKAVALNRELKIDSLESLQKACVEGRVAGLKGFGEKTQQKILAGIDFTARVAGQFRLADALPLARTFEEHLRRCAGVKEVSVAGSVRRRKEVVRDMDFVVAAADAAKVTAHFLKHPEVAETIGSGDTKTSVRLKNGIQADLRVVAPGQFPFTLAYFTGSKEHNIIMRQRAQERGLKLNEYGLFKGKASKKCRTEEDVFEELGLAFIPPELRESAGEFEAAAKGRLPDLVTREDLRGTFHNHTTESDGIHSLEQMVDAARKRGLSYLGISDHSKSAGYAHGLDAARLKKQWAAIDKLNAGMKGFRILKGSETDILPDGALDWPDEILAKLDFVIASVHSHFTLSKDEQTKRTVRALAHPKVSMIGHPTGRLLLSREPFAIDLEAVLQAAKKHGKCVELNANSYRLDLDAQHVRRAKELGLLVSINPDAHAMEGLDDLEYGIGTARRGWLTKKDVLNTRPLDEVLRVLRG